MRARVLTCRPKPPQPRHLRLPHFRSEQPREHANSRNKLCNAAEATQARGCSAVAHHPQSLFLKSLLLPCSCLTLPSRDMMCLACCFCD